jgi:glycosyltransferase involved in cell wall biosynthesis
MMVLRHGYSNSIYNKKILIIGPYPPPNGGVEIHIKRVTKKLETQKNTVSVFNTALDENNRPQSIFSLLKLFFKIKPDIVFLHEPTISRLRLWITTLLKLLFKITFITIDHNCRILYEYSEWNKKIFRFCMKQADKKIVIGDTTDRCYKENNVQSENYSIESAYLPPKASEEQAILKKYPLKIIEFIETHSPLLIANAFTLSLYKGKDLYGLDICIDLIKKLKKKSPKIGLLFALATEGNEEQKAYLAQMQKIIARLDLEKNICIFTNKHEIWPLIKKADLFVRPTLSDGHSVSVQEADDLGIPIIASNVCIRPHNTILFEKSNLADFIDKTETSLHSIGVL